MKNVNIYIYIMVTKYLGIFSVNIMFKVQVRNSLTLSDQPKTVIVIKYFTN